MNRKLLILLVTGLVVGALVGIPIAFGGNNETYEPETVNDAESAFDTDAVNDTGEANVIFDTGETDVADVVNDEPEDNTVMMIPQYFSITGDVVSLEEVDDMIRVTIEDSYGNPAILVLSEETVFPFAEEFDIGDTVTGWYATDAPMILIWPAEYNIAVLVAGAPDGVNIRVDRFNAWADREDAYMLSQDNMFAFMVNEDTQVILANGDDFSDGDFDGRCIVVIYGVSTRSIPEMTTADRLIVLYESVEPF